MTYSTHRNVCENDPATASEWLPEFCNKVGAPPPPTGGNATRAAWARGARNHKARKELTWSPRYPSWREGFAALAA